MTRAEWFKMQRDAVVVAQKMCTETHDLLDEEVRDFINMNDLSFAPNAEKLEQMRVERRRLWDEIMRLDDLWLKLWRKDLYCHRQGQVRPVRQLHA